MAIAAVVFCCTVIILTITVPLCICCCLGAEIGASSSRSTPQTTVVGTLSTTATVVTSKTETNEHNDICLSLLITGIESIDTYDRHIYQEIMYLLVVLVQVSCSEYICA